MSMNLNKNDKITKYPVTPEEFYECFQIHWQDIADMYDEYENYKNGEDIKIAAFETRFDLSDYVESWCFGCDFATEYCYNNRIQEEACVGTYCLNYCLLECNVEKRCLDDHWDEFKAAIANEEYRTAQTIAEQIRDTPINPKILP